MIRRMIRATALTMCAWLALAGLAAAQGTAPKDAEVKSEVPALTAMHEVIMPMWHDAWPKKDTAALAAMTGKLEKHMSAVEKAVLPGILRDKTSPWMEGVKKLRASVNSFKAAAELKNDEALLKAAEGVHSDYEALVKVVRPVLKEMDDFHGSLYVLYHHQLNPLDLAGAAQTVKDMQAKMTALNAATLPDRLKAKQDVFVAQRTRLSKALDSLVALACSKNEPKIREAVELLHMEYEKLEKVF